MVTKAELFAGRGVKAQQLARQLSAQKKQIDTQAYSQKVKEKQTQIEKQSKYDQKTAIVAKLRAAGYIEVIEEGKVVLKAPNKQEGGGKISGISYSPKTVVLDAKGHIKKQTETSSYTTDTGGDQEKRTYTSRVVTYKEDGSYVEQLNRLDDQDNVRSYQTNHYNEEGGLIDRDEGSWRAVETKRKQQESDVLQAKRAVREGKIKDVEDYKYLKTGMTSQQIQKAKALTPEAQMKEFGAVLYQTKSRPETKKALELQQGAYTVIGKDLQRKLEREPIRVKQDISKQMVLPVGGIAIQSFESGLSKYQPKDKTVSEKIISFMQSPAEERRRKTIEVMEKSTERAFDLLVSQVSIGAVGYPKIEVGKSLLKTREEVLESEPSGIKKPSKKVITGVLLGIEGIVKIPVRALKAEQYVLTKRTPKELKEDVKESIKGTIKVFKERPIETTTALATEIITLGFVSKIISGKPIIKTKPRITKVGKAISVVKKKPIGIGELTKIKTVQSILIKTGKKVSKVSVETKGITLRTGKIRFGASVTRIAKGKKILPQKIRAGIIAVERGKEVLGIKISLSPTKATRTLTAFRSKKTPTYTVIKEGLIFKQTVPTQTTVFGIKQIGKKTIKGKTKELGFQQFVKAKDIEGGAVYVGETRTFPSKQILKEVRFEKIRVTPMGKRGTAVLYPTVQKLTKTEGLLSIEPLTTSRGVISILTKGTSKFPKSSLLLLSIPKRKEDIETRIETIRDIKKKQDEIKDIGVVNIQESVLTSSYEIKQTTDILQKVRQQQKEKQDLVLKQEPTLELEQEQRTLIGIEIPEIIEIPKLPVFLPPVIPRSKTKIKEPSLRQQAYDVLVKRKQLKKGKGSYESRGYKKANKKPLTKEAATGLGMSTTDKFANRSFKLKKAKGKAVKRSDLESKYRQLKSKFRKAKKNQQIFVEKAKHAIDSVQERRQITFEGLKARKRQMLLNIQARSVQKASNINFGLKQTKEKVKKQQGMKFI
jgi:hypothetical protein